jgi:hypothetical protein
MTDIGTKNIVNSCLPSEKYINEFKKTEVFIDLGNYADLSQLELSKKIPKWERILNNKQINNGVYYQTQSRKKYCRDCTESEKFIHSNTYDDNGHKRDFRKPNESFWKAYRHLFRELLKEARNFYEKRKSENKVLMLDKISKHQNTQVICECGGKYTTRNKQTHSTTTKIYYFVKKYRN